MKAAALGLLESAIIRAGPGLLNLLTLGLLADRLSATSYGIYSTAFATATTFGGVLLGPVIYGILPEYNRSAAAGEQSRFVGLILGVVVVSFALVGVVMLFMPWAAAALLATTASGGMTTLQELLRGQLRLWGYGAVALAQALTFVSCVFYLVDYDAPELALWIYAGSCVFGTCVGFTLLGFPRPRFREIGRLKPVVKVGGIYTVSTVVEGSFTLGLRYLFLVFGTRETLAIFSFCIDMSQRLVGIMINLATFQYVPRAYKRAEEGGDAAFLAVLRQGAGVGAAAALISMLSILGLREFGLLPSNVSSLLDPPIFVLIALGLAVNRLKKLLVDPVAVRFEKTHFILIGYLVAAPIMLSSVAFALWKGSYHLVAIALLCGYLLATFVARIGYLRAKAGRDQAVV